MTASRSDALVLFGASGDLAYTQIFPALQALIRRGHLDMPIVGVARSHWTLDQLKARVKDSLHQHGDLDPAAYTKLCSPWMLLPKRMNPQSGLMTLGKSRAKVYVEHQAQAKAPSIVFIDELDAVARAGRRDSVTQRRAQGPIGCYTFPEKRARHCSSEPVGPRSRSGVSLASSRPRELQ